MFLRNSESMLQYVLISNYQLHWDSECFFIGSLSPWAPIYWPQCLTLTGRPSWIEDGNWILADAVWKCKWHHTDDHFGKNPCFGSKFATSKENSSYRGNSPFCLWQCIIVFFQNNAHFNLLLTSLMKIITVIETRHSETFGGVEWVRIKSATMPDVCPVKIWNQCLGCRRDVSLHQLFLAATIEGNLNFFQ